MAIQFTAREQGKLNAHVRVYKRFYDHFDFLPPACRAAQRETQTWSRSDLIRCGAGDCGHRHEQPQITNL